MQAANELLWKKEASVFSRYLIGEEPDELSVALYIKAQQKFAIPMSPKDAEKLQFTLNHPFYLGMIDGALGIINPEHPIRRKLYIMFSILESNPIFHKEFLPQERKGSYLFIIMWTGTRAVCNTLFGFILLPWI